MSEDKKASYGGKVRIGAVDYDIFLEEDLERDKEELNGLMLYDKAQIILDSNMPIERRRAALIHEITHGLINEAGYNKDSELQKEETAERLGIMLHGFIRDNLDWINQNFGGYSNEN